MPILSLHELKRRLYDKTIEKEEQLIVTPILDKEKQITNSGIDLRISNQFIVFKPENISHFNVGEVDHNNIRKFQSHVIVPFHEKFILHPKTLVLGSTLEYISMPRNCWGLLEGRSSWARLGLIIATASSIDAGYKGCITLELTNLGNLPICLYPGLRIGQLILSDTTSVELYKEDNKYFVQIGPEFSKIQDDDDIKIFTRK